MDLVNKELQTYAITFSYSDPGFSTVILAGKDEEVVRKLVADMTERMTDVKIISVDNLKDAKAIEEFYLKQMQNQNQGSVN